MTRGRLAEIRSLLTRATPGPWEASYHPVTSGWYVTPAGIGLTGSICEVNNWQSGHGSYDAALIGATPTVIGELLAEIDRYRALLERTAKGAGPFRQHATALTNLWCPWCKRPYEDHSPDCPWPEVLKEAGLQ